MEQEIKLETSYHLSHGALKKMFISLALSMYDHLRHPNYDEKELLQLLTSDFKRFVIDTQLLLEQMPKDSRLRGMFAFFENHYVSLKQITSDLN